MYHFDLAVRIATNIVRMQMHKFMTYCVVGALFAAPVAASELPFETISVKATQLPQQLTLEATIEAINHSTVSAETSGRITEINFDTDDFVREGQVLMRITSAEQQASLALFTAASPSSSEACGAICAPL